MNLNQLTIIGFIGRNAESKSLPNGKPATKFSVATTRSWKDDKGVWKEKTQWHNVRAFGQGFAQIAPRLLKGTHVLVQGELSTREYDRTITVPNGKKSIEHVIQQLVVELKPIRSGFLIAPVLPNSAKWPNSPPMRPSPSEGDFFINSRDGSNVPERFSWRALASLLR
jgi:single-strand DNA-binding protein